MKTLLTLVFILTTIIYSQTYLVVTYNNGSTANNTDLSQIQKITFTGSEVNYLLTDNSTVAKTISLLDKMTFSSTNGGNPLPVEMKSFTAHLSDGIVNLLWSTATEKDNYGFEVERSVTKSEKWEKIGFVQGNGNSNSPKSYTFEDKTPLLVKSLYRLKQIDFGGKFQYSEVVEVDFIASKNFALKQNYPNPFNPLTKIAYNIPVDGRVTMKVYDVIGTEVITLVNENKKAGSYEVFFDGSKLASGVYFCKMISGSYSNLIKMLIMK